jgi:putative tryptophan/tyrosine transport system substrate-binding protein
MNRDPATIRSDLDRRRFLLTSPAGVLATPPGADAQPGAKQARVGVLLFAAGDPNFVAFRQALRDLGYVEGRTVVFESRSADGVLDRLGDLATELVRIKPDMIVALGGDVAPFVTRATSTIPIVVWTSADPVKARLVASLARPGANVTGITLQAADLAAKRMQFLNEAAPAITRVGILWNPEHEDDELQQTEAAARALGVQIQSLEVRRLPDFDGAFQAARGRVEAVIVVSSRQLFLNRTRILEFGASNKLPLVTGWGPWTQGGALLSYGPDLNAMARRLATYVDRVVKRARPADLPIEQPTKFELLINMKTAKALGLTISPSLLARADQVIE